MEWSYSGTNGPDNWFKIYSAAAGERQSPVDINLKASIEEVQNGKNKLKWYYHSNDMFQITNTGHSWQISSDNHMSEISGGPLICDYELAQIHAHWGENDLEGSEHTINGRYYSAELHLVHWNKTNYATFEEAINHPDGLCVFGVLLKLGNDNPELEKVIEKIPDIQYKGDTTKLSTSFNPRKLLPYKSTYWTYMGSLTTPPCLECVIWIVFSEPIEISSRQLEVFRSLRHHTSDECNSENSCYCQLVHNCRSIAPLGDRVILCSGPIQKFSHLNIFNEITE